MFSNNQTAPSLQPNQLTQYNYDPNKMAQQQMMANMLMGPYNTTPGYGSNSPTAAGYGMGNSYSKPNANYYLQNIYSQNGLAGNPVLSNLNPPGYY